MPEDLMFTDARTHTSRKYGLAFDVNVPKICCKDITFPFVTEY